MYRCRAISLIAGVLIAHGCLCQTDLNSIQVEEKSYQLYLNKEWNGLIDFGKVAIDSGVDYFYLRLRLGIAYYETDRYRLAEAQFRKALEFNSQDDISREYQYYSLLYSEQYDEARRCAVEMSDALKKKLHVSEWKATNMVFMEGGPKIPSTSTQFGTAVYVHGGLNHSISNKISLTHAITYYGQNLVEGSFSQIQYYINGSIPLKNGWLISPTFQYVERSLSSTSTTPGPKGPGPPKPPQTIQSTTSSSAWVGSVSLAKRFGYADVSLASVISNVEGYSQFIEQATLTIYPLANSRLSLGAFGYYHWGTTYLGEFAINPFISFRPARKLYLQANYFRNNNVNIIERNGYIVNNSPDVTSSRWSVVADLSILKKTSFYGLFIFENKANVITGNYTYSTFILGLKHIF